MPDEPAVNPSTSEGDPGTAQFGISRRDFLVGAGAAGIATVAHHIPVAAQAGSTLAMAQHRQPRGGMSSIPGSTRGC